MSDYRQILLSVFSLTEITQQNSMNEICFFTVSLRSCIVYFESTELKNTKSSGNWLQCSLWFVYCTFFALISNDIHSTFVSVWRHYEKELNKTPCWLDCQLQIVFCTKILRARSFAGLFRNENTRNWR